MVTDIKTFIDLMERDMCQLSRTLLLIKSVISDPWSSKVAIGLLKKY